MIEVLKTNRMQKLMLVYIKPFLIKQKLIPKLHIHYFANHLSKLKKEKLL